MYQNNEIEHQDFDISTQRTTKPRVFDRVSQAKSPFHSDLKRRKKVAFLRYATEKTDNGVIGETEPICKYPSFCRCATNEVTGFWGPHLWRLATQS